MIKIETIRRPRNVIERLLDGIETVTEIRLRTEDTTERRHISRALDEAKTAAGDNDGDRVMRVIKLLEAIAKRYSNPVSDEHFEFVWPVYLEPKTLAAAGHIGLALVEDGFQVKRQDVSVNAESGSYLVDQYVRGEDESVTVKLPPAPERRLVTLV